MQGPGQDHLARHVARVRATLLADGADARGVAEAIGPVALDEGQPEAEGPLGSLVRGFGLDGTTRDMVLAAIALQEDPSLAGRVGARVGWGRLVPGGPDGPSAALLAALVTAAEPGGARGWSVGDDAGAPVWHVGLLVPSVAGAAAGRDLHTLPVHVPGHWVASLSGRRQLSAELWPVARRLLPALPLELVALPDDWRETLAHTAGAFFTREAAPSLFEAVEGFAAGQGLVMQLTGPSGTGKTALAKGLAHRLQRPLIVVDGAALAASQRLHELLHVLFVEAQLYGELLCLERSDALLRSDTPAAGAFRRLIERHRVCVLVEARDGGGLDPRVVDAAVLRYDLPHPGVEARKHLWQTQFPERVSLDIDVDIDHLSATFPLTGAGIRNVGRLLSIAAVGAETGGEEEGGRIIVTQTQVAEAAGLQIRDTLPTDLLTVQRVRRTLDDLVLDDQTFHEVDEIRRAIRVRTSTLEKWGLRRVFQRGLGVICLFDGPSGTGKTHCAEVLASAAGLDLVRVRSSQVTNKYIGEAEKALERIFELTDPNRHLLLFDEADGFFAKRTSVQRSSDRYANMEINSLLQLTEAYSGVVVLTTNLKEQMDKAFERRITFKVSFPMPDPKSRERIWRALLPAELPLADDVDLGQMAEDFPLTGGSIKNAILRAAYAAGEAVALSQAALETAARREAAACGMLVREPGTHSDF